MTMTMADRVLQLAGQIAEPVITVDEHHLCTRPFTDTSGFLSVSRTGKAPGMTMTMTKQQGKALWRYVKKARRELSYTRTAAYETLLYREVFASTGSTLLPGPRDRCRAIWRLDEYGPRWPNEDHTEWWDAFSLVPARPQPAADDDGWWWQP